MEQLTDKQEKILTVIKKFIAENGYAPTIRELCNLCGLSSTATMFVHLKNLTNKELENHVIPQIVPGWDHSPRSTSKALIYTHSTPEAFYLHCKEALLSVKEKKDKILLLKSWNEWGEGNYMEPDIKNGRGFITSLKKAITDIFQNNG